MAKRTKDLTQQLAVRVEPDLLHLLEEDARQHGRNVAQSIRFHLRAALVTP